MSFRNALYNAGYLFNHLFFTRSHSWYRLTKRLGTLVLGMRYTVALDFAPGIHRGSVQGYRHSANSFALGLVTAPPKVHSHVHWIWGITGAIGSGVVPLVLVRKPRDVLISTVRRTRQGLYPHHYALMPAVCLITWYRYYASVRRHLDRVCLVDFDEITCPRCYGRMRAGIERRTGLALAPHPDFAPVNPSTPSAIKEEFSPFTEILLWGCTRFHQRLLKARSRPEEAPGYLAQSVVISRDCAIHGI
jgi:hypothetical protein